MQIANRIEDVEAERLKLELRLALLEGQEKLLSRYIASFHDDGLELKIYLNEELGRLRAMLDNCLNSKEIANDQVLYENAQKVLGVLHKFRDTEIDAAMIQQVLKIQSLVEEISN